MSPAEIRKLAAQHGWLRDEAMEVWKFACPVCQRESADDYVAASVGDDGSVVCLGGCPPERVALKAGIARREDTVQLLTVDEMLALPDPAWLVDGLIPDAGLGVLFGPSGVGKSFITLGVALSVASGVPWLGHRVEQRYVVYIAAEGGAGLKKRVIAWMAEHPGADLSRMRFVTGAVNLLDPAKVAEVDAALDGLPERPGLVVVDTLARSMVGGDENSAQDMGAFVAHLDLLGRGDLVLVVHHTGRDGVAERGSSALEGAADVRVKVSKPPNAPDSREFELRCEKLKDWAEWDPLAVILRARADSCVVALVDEVAAARARHERAPKRSEMAEEVLGLLAEAVEPISRPDIANAVGRGPKDGTVRRALVELVADGKVIEHRDGARKTYSAKGASLPVAPPGTPGTAQQGATVPPPEGGTGHGTPVANGTEPAPGNAILGADWDES